MASHAYQRALARRGFATYEKACPLLVPLVEEGWTEHPVTEQIARIYVIEALYAARLPIPMRWCWAAHITRCCVPCSAGWCRSASNLSIWADSTAQVVASLVSSCEQDGHHGEPTFRLFTTDSVEKFPTHGAAVSGAGGGRRREGGTWRAEGEDMSRITAQDMLA